MDRRLGAAPSAESTGDTDPLRLTFSFDSSGWLYVYHLGAAHFLQQHVLPHLDAEQTAFSGSSGGALVAAALCTGVDVEEVKEAPRA